MAHNCDFSMKITGEESAIKEMLAMLSWQGEFKETGLGRIYFFDADEIENTDIPGICSVQGYGDCAWSVETAMCDYNGQHPSLESETERLGLVVEVYSSEPGVGFQEHYIIAHGERLVDECVDYEEHCVECCQSLEEYNKEYETEFTEDMINEDGNVCIGGFGDDYGVFKDLSSYFQEKCVFLWKDIVSINGECFAEEFPISGKLDGDTDNYNFQIDEFLDAVAVKYGVNVDEITTYMFDDIDFDPKKMPFGAEDCGCYINGTPEWLMEPEEFKKYVSASAMPIDAQIKAAELNLKENNVNRVVRHNEAR